MRQSLARVGGISLVQNFDLLGYGRDYSGSLVLGGVGGVEWVGVWSESGAGGV